MQSNSFFKLGNCYLDILNRTVLRDGQSLSLQSKTYEVLLILIQNKDRVVTREELKNAAWGEDVYVEESALGFQINRLRKVLGDSASDPQYIKTYPKLGFRFIANLEELENLPDHLRDGHSSISVSSKEELPTNPGDGMSQMNHAAHHLNESVREFNAVSGTVPLESADGIARPCISARLPSLFGGHLLHVMIGCALYASLYAIALLAEIAYQFDRYGRTGTIIALLSFFWIFFTSIAGLALDWKKTLSDGANGLIFSGLIFLVAASLLYGGVVLFLPSTPITEASFQTYTSQAAYLKTISYFLVLVVIYLLMPYHFVLAMQRELQKKKHHLAFELLTGSKTSVAPTEALYPRGWVLALLLAAVIIIALFLHHNLMSQLKPGPYMNLFAILIYVRLILYLALGVECLIWYFRALNELKRECFVAENIR